MTLKIRIALALTVACLSQHSSWANGSGAEQLELVPEPILESADPEVRDQLTERRRKLSDLLERGDIPPADIAREFGELGGLYLLYGFPGAAEAALDLAHGLASDEFRWAYLLGFARQTEGMFEEANLSYEEALALRPQYLAAMVRSGMVLLERNKLDEASRRFKSALDISTTCAAARYGLGKVALAWDDPDEAVKQFEAALELQPSASAINYPLSQAYRQMGKMEIARQHLKAVGRTEVSVPDPELARLRGLATGAAVHFVRGKRALAQGNMEEALKEFRRAAEADPESAPIRRALGLALKTNGEVTAAVTEYEKALELEPANPLNHQDLALALVEARDLGVAAKHFRRALELDPSFGDANVGLGVVLSRQGEYEPAIENLERALQINPLDRTALFEKSFALFRAGRLAESKSSFLRLIDLAPDHAEAHLNLARLHEILNDLEAARSAANTAYEVATSPTLRARANLLLGRVAERQEDYSAALKYYETSTMLEGEFAPSHIRKGAVLARSGSYSGAAEAYGKALLLIPDQVAVRLAQASSWIQDGKYARARDAFVAGLQRKAPTPHLARAMAMLLATCPDPDIRQPERALDLARRAYLALHDGISAQILAMALAANGQFEEAIGAQGRILEMIGGKVSDEAIRLSRERLASYKAGEALRSPWISDSSLLASPILGLPALRR